jgi:hypothetical protein
MLNTPATPSSPDAPHDGPARRRRRFRQATLGGALALGTATAGFLALNQTGPTGAEATYEAAFDPTTVALGVDTPAERTTLEQGQVDFATRMDQDDLGALSLNDAWGSAIDDLYARVEATPEAETVRGQWFDCMARRGQPLESREQLAEADPTADGFEALLAAGDSCDSEVQADTNRLVEAQYPDWAEENSALINQYAEALELPTS